MKNISEIISKVMEISRHKNAIILGLIKLCKLLLNTLFLIHVFACLFLGINTLEDDKEVAGWLAKYSDGRYQDD
jgi:hypothetical protein